MRRLLFVIALPLLATACGGSTFEYAPVAQKPSPLLDPEYTEDGLFGERFDVNLDGRADIVKYFQYKDDSGANIAAPRTFDPKAKYVRSIVRKELDTNLDGNIDVIRSYDTRGNLTGERLDTNFNGKFDVAAILTRGAISRVDLDENEDGTPEKVAFFRGGRLQRVESDPNQNGATDSWSYFDRGALTRVGFDYNGDGVIDDSHIRHAVEIPVSPGTASPAPAEGSGSN
jgi:hypothetical protein